MAAMKKQQDKKREWLSLGHGEYQEVSGMMVLYSC